MTNPSILENTLWAPRKVLIQMVLRGLLETVDTWTDCLSSRCHQWRLDKIVLLTGPLGILKEILGIAHGIIGEICVDMVTGGLLQGPSHKPMFLNICQDNE